jgi:DNA-binding MarR family transcriptional regulator
MDKAPETRWLTDGEMEAWLALVGLIVRLPAALDAQLRRDAGITHFDYQVLAMLSAAPDGRLRMSQLATDTAASLSRLSHGVKRLEDRGWVRRCVDPDDGRAILATLTTRGMQALRATAPGHVAAVRRHVFDQLDERQVAQLRAIATRVNDTIEPVGG